MVSSGIAINGSTRLPSNWALVKFGDVFDIQGGSQPPKSTFVFEPREGYIRLLQIRDYGDKPVPTYVPIDSVTKFCEQDDVMIARYGASLGRILTGMKGAYNVALVRVIFDRQRIFGKYIYYLLMTDRFQHPIHMISRSAQNGFNKSDLNPIELPLAPLNEQRRIVDAIEAHFTRLDAVVAALKRSQANLRRYRASVLKAACEGRLVPTEAELAHAEGRAYEPADVLLERILAERRRKWEEAEWAKLVEKAQKKVAQERRKAVGRPAKLSDLTDAEWQGVSEEEYAPYLPKNDKWKAKYQKPELVDVNGLPALPEGWVLVEALTICDPITNGTTPKYPKVMRGTGEIPFLKTHNVTSHGVVDFEDRLHFISQEVCDSELGRSTARPGDVLLNTVGPPIGKSAVIPDTYRKLNINQNLTIYRTVKDICVPEFLCFWFQSPGAKLLIERTSTATAGQYYLNLGNCRQLPVPLPSLAEQHRIVAEVERRLSVIDALEATVEANLARAERLRQSILKHAFEGKLVPQDPDDEPASVLLAKIRPGNELHNADSDAHRQMRLPGIPR